MKWQQSFSLWALQNSLRGRQGVMERLNLQYMAPPLLMFQQTVPSYTIFCSVQCALMFSLTLYTGLSCPLLCPWPVIITTMYNAHPYFSFRNLGRKVHVTHSKIWCFKRRASITSVGGKNIIATQENGKKKIQRLKIDSSHYYPK